MTDEEIITQIIQIVGTQVGFGAVVSSFLVIFGTAFVGDFTGPARKLIANLLNLETITKTIHPRKYLREEDGHFMEETVRDIAV